ncbi:MAG TPA: Mini-ribonuclease 3 [Kosmotogaceae bacterium]|nr:Mini-ribonuclease 3 [Kosmotogaceae bacterium]
MENLFSSSREANEVSTDALAFIGDAICTLYYRLRFLGEGSRRTSVEHERITAFVSSKGQSMAYEALIGSLDEEERRIMRRGFNSRGAKRHGDDLEYRRATALEALFGYLFLKKKYQRIRELLEAVISVVSSR